MSTVKVNKIDKRTGSTLTIGGSGTTVTLACGATQSGFGRTGTVDWCTTAKTAPFTAVSGNGYFVNTTCGAVTVTLPASPSAGDIISIADYASTFQTNNATLCRNSSKINGECTNASLSTKGQSITLVYVDGTRGWKNTMDSTSDVTGASYITATGGTVTTCGDYKIHTFTSPGTFCVSQVGNPAGSTSVSYLVVAGGGAGGTDRGGGGGAGGMRFSLPCGITCYPASPLNAASNITVSATSYPITVGAGGAAAPNTTCVSGSGTSSTFSTITSAGGGGGDNDGAPGGVTGGSGGGGSNSRPGLAGNTPPTSPPQGTAGGNATGGSGGGGGGGGLTAGSPGNSPGGAGGGGGGYPTIFGSSNGETCGSFRYFSGGGGGGNLGTGGLGGGGSGGTGTTIPGANGVSGTCNTGGGGGGGGTWPINNCIRGGNGGSGIVVITYKYQ